ncbi:hypothetical protein BOX15_Mlig020749g1, partial [Macrostomum lignano]
SKMFHLRAQSPVASMSLTFVKGDISDELRRNLQGVIGTVAAENQDNQEAMARAVKQRLDSSLGSGWQVVIGRSYSCQVIHEKGSFANFSIGPYVMAVWRAGF